MRENEKEVLSQLRPGTPEYTYVSSMAVAENNRRKGLASAVLRAAEQQSELWGQPHLALHVSAFDLLCSPSCVYRLSQAFSLFASVLHV